MASATPLICKKAKEILKQIYANDPLIIKEDGITVYVDELADSSVVLGARGWTNTSDYWTVRWRILEQIKLQFDQAGIEIPFNQLDVNVKNVLKIFSRNLLTVSIKSLIMSIVSFKST